MHVMTVNTPPFFLNGRRWLALGMVCWAAGAGHAQIMTPAKGTPPQSTAKTSATDRLIIKYRDGASASSQVATSASSDLFNRAVETARQHGVVMSVARATATGAHVMQMDQRMSVSTARELATTLAAADSRIEYVEPDTRLIALGTTTPDDTLYARQWHYTATSGINLPAAWALSTGSDVVVAVLDTGYLPHPDLRANLLKGYDFISSSTRANDGNTRDRNARDTGDAVEANECGYTHDAEDSSWHGTHVAGTIAAVTNNGKGVAGVAPDAKILPVRVLGKCGGYLSDVSDAIIWAAGGHISGVPANTQPAQVINLSLGSSGRCSTTMQNAVNSARAKGAVVVVAAGNNAANASNYTPASCSGVITVAAVGSTGQRASYSNYGSGVKIAAPGGDTRVDKGVLSTLNSGTTTPARHTYGWMSGTSMATPHVAGVAALMLSANPNLTPDQVASLMTSTARAFSGSCFQCGSGIVDAYAAVSAALAQSSE